MLRSVGEGEKEGGGVLRPLHEDCPQHHGHKGDTGVTPDTYGAIGEKAQVIVVGKGPMH